MGKVIKKEEINQKLKLADQISLEEDAPILRSSKVIEKEKYLAQDEVNQIILNAKEEAKEIKQKAKDLLGKVKEYVEDEKQKGFEQGKNQGLKDTADYLSRLSAQHEKLMQNLEKEVLKLVYDIAEKIIGQDLSERENSMIGLITQGLQNALGDRFVILVHPHDLERVKKHKPKLAQVIGAGKMLQLQADEKVEVNGCLIQTEMGTIDAELSTQLEIIREVLGIKEESDLSPIKQQGFQSQSSTIKEKKESDPKAAMDDKKQDSGLDGDDWFDF